MKKLISCKFVLIRGFFQTSNMLQRFNFKLALMYPEIGIFFNMAVILNFRHLSENPSS